MSAPGTARRRVGRLAAALALATGALATAACGPGQDGPPPLRVWTTSYEFRITMDPSPPRAREPIRYRIVVLDRQTKQFVEGGEGRIFATSPDSANTWDSFVPAPEAGTYTAKLNYITAGDWRVNLQFRRDSLAPLEKAIDDWVQAVRGARPIGERPIN